MSLCYLQLTVDESGGEALSEAIAMSVYVAVDSLSRPLFTLTTPVIGSIIKASVSSNE